MGLVVWGMRDYCVRVKRAFDGRDRRSIRLRNYDYREGGAYFVTICTYARDCLFGVVSDERMVLNDAGDLLSRIWARTVNEGRMPAPNDFVVMPNHVHGVVWLSPLGERDGEGDVVGARQLAARDCVSDKPRSLQPESCHESVDASPLQHADGALTFGACAAGSLGAVVGSFKSVSARAINRLRGTPGLAVWQRGYYERILRGDGDLSRIRQYIFENPMRWHDDPDNEGVGAEENTFEPG